MALVGTRVEAIREGNTNLTVKTDILLDPETGLVVERKTVVAEVQTEDGKTAVIAGQRTVAAVQVKSTTLLKAIGQQGCARPKPHGMGGPCWTVQHVRSMKTFR